MWQTFFTRKTFIIQSNYHAFTFAQWEFIESWNIPAEIDTQIVIVLFTLGSWQIDTGSAVLILECLSWWTCITLLFWIYNHTFAFRVNFWIFYARFGAPYYHFWRTNWKFDILKGLVTIHPWTIFNFEFDLFQRFLIYPFFSLCYFRAKKPSDVIRFTSGIVP